MKQLQDGGYETASIGKTHYHGRPGSQEAGARGERFDTRQFGDFVKGFGWDYVMEEYDRYGHVQSHVKSPYMDFLEARGLLEAHQEQIRGIYRLTPTHWRGETSVLPQECELSSFIADHAMDWLQSRDSEKPFYLHLGFVQPHVPLMDDPIWAAYYADADIELPDMTMPSATNEVWAGKVERLKAHSQVQTMTDDFVREGIRHYLGAVSLVDQKIGEVIDTLDALGGTGQYVDYLQRGPRRDARRTPFVGKALFLRGFGSGSADCQSAGSQEQRDLWRSHAVDRCGFDNC